MLAATFSRMIRNVFFYSYRLATSFFRMTPNFIIIGAPKCGTTSLYNYLIQHPQILSSSRKEPMFFSMFYNKNPLWYKINFPIKFGHSKKITGEASTSYLIYPNVPKLVKEMLPDVKIIIMLRNPIDRSFSQYTHHYRSGVETLSFEEAINEEEKRLQGTLEEIENSKPLKGFSYLKSLFFFNPSNILTFSNLFGGIYVDQIKNWTDVFPSDQIKIVFSEEFFKDSDKIYQDVLKFLELPSYKLMNYKAFNADYKKNPSVSNPKMNIDTRKKLVEYFKPHNKRLSDFLNKPINWDS
ncbi:sulfotransferase domain-containing protein [Nitrosopumilus maritimus]|uniref:Sulfotransferase n=1 Tax=Nitrosopumilus maritimus (strain SCM1) TaxID=436308 RepID=A9A1U1_NITMS|nr:sulfotransferase domain-containing protein [Nitrosopumilus maritimus]ABX12062.1 sulfotransferase [Nitrosopumilus maritimus SCM1]